MTHKIWSRLACSLSIMLGIAMFTIVKSSKVMKNPSETTIRIAHGLPRNLLTASPYCRPTGHRAALPGGAARAAAPGAGRAPRPSSRMTLTVFLAQADRHSSGAARQHSGRAGWLAAEGVGGRARATPRSRSGSVFALTAPGAEGQPVMGPSRTELRGGRPAGRHRR